MGGAADPESVAHAVFRAVVMLQKEDAKDPHDHESWWERDVWLGRSGRMYYESKKDGRTQTLLDGKGVSHWEIQRMRPGYSCWPEAFSVGLSKSGAADASIPEPPLVFGAADDGTVDDFLNAVSLFAKSPAAPVV